MNTLDKIDIIIPTYKPDERFIRLLELIARQTYPVNRVLVINTERKYYDEFMLTHRNPIPDTVFDVIHISYSDFDHAATRKMAASLSIGRFFVMMTQDAIPYDEHLIEKLIAPLRNDSQIAVSYARQLPSPGATLTESYVRDFNYPAQSRVKSADDLDELGIKTYFCSDVCAAYNRQIYNEVGGFIDRAIFNEDMIYAASAVQKGYKISYTADARVYHSHNYSAMQQFHRNFDLAVSQVDHPEVFAGLPSEGEGMRLVKSCISYLAQKRKPWLIPGFVINCGGRFMGFRLGKIYRRLPRRVVMWATSNPGYWERID